MKRIYACVLFALVFAIPLSAAAQEAITLRDVDVYAGPSSEFPPVARLAPNSPVRVVGCLGDWSWCDVGFADNRGWVYAADLGYPYQGNRVAIIEYGPRIGLPVVSFSLQAYWDAHFRGRPWYGEREQWVSRVRVQGDRGGRPPEGHAAAPGRAVEGSATVHGVPRPGQAPAPQPGQAGAPQAGQSATPTPPDQATRPPEGSQSPRNEDRGPGREASSQAGRPPEPGKSMEAPGRAPESGKSMEPGRAPESGKSMERSSESGKSPADKSRPQEGQQK